MHSTTSASVSTWSKKIRERGWKRPRKRLYPAKPKVGIRASAPNQIWHVDASVIRLLDGTKVYLHAVLDNFSRKILAWRVCDQLAPLTTVGILREAAAHIGVTPMLVADSGVENVNSDVDALVESGVIRRVLALVQVTYSNSMIEAYWRSLKHQWLYLCELSSSAALQKLVAFHVEQHNSVMPHSALRGQTPDEVYSGTGEHVAAVLANAGAAARARRRTHNRAASCEACAPESPVMSPGLQLHPPESWRSSNVAVQNADGPRSRCELDSTRCYGSGSSAAAPDPVRCTGQESPRRVGSGGDRSDLSRSARRATARRPP